jgi:ParB-like chromosome segregation protein Spo0J
MKTPWTDARLGRRRKMKLPFEIIRLDFQPKENLIEETVESYVSAIRNGEKLEPITVRFDGSNYFLQDGFHRLEAARRTARKEIRADVSPGTLEEMEAEWREMLDRLKESWRATPPAPLPKMKKARP